ncbi:MAG: DUF2726 domain-containing protein [Pseudomonadota bacterium]
MHPALTLTPSPLLSLVRALTPEAIARPDHALTPEDREEVFARLCVLAHRKGFHVAPGVAIGGVLRVRDGRKRGTVHGAKRALAQERVDALILDRTAWPLLAINLAEADRKSRAGRRRLAQKTRLFSRAGLSLLHLGGTEDWDKNQTLIEGALADATQASRA